MAQEEKPVDPDRDPAAVGEVAAEGSEERLIQGIGGFASFQAGSIFFPKSTAQLCAIGQFMIAIAQLHALVIGFKTFSHWFSLSLYDAGESGFMGRVVGEDRELILSKRRFDGVSEEKVDQSIFWPIGIGIET